MSRTQRRYGTKLQKGLSHHHRHPRSKGGSDESSNISVVGQKSHNLWHAMFNNDSAQEICAQINALWLDPRYRFICEEVE